MKLMIFRKGRSVFLLITLNTLLFGCGSQMSETIQDDTAGMNGSFEIVKSGLPVNWLFFTPSTIPEGDYELIIDTSEHKDGKQSLKFLVRDCVPTGGWHSPGFKNEFDAKEGETYKVTFWVKNDGCEFVVQVGGVSAFEGENHTVVKSDEMIVEWRQFEYVYTIPENMERLHFGMNILKPGTFWIDDIRIVKLESMSEKSS